MADKNSTGDQSKYPGRKNVPASAAFPSIEMAQIMPKLAEERPGVLARPPLAASPEEHGNSVTFRNVQCSYPPGENLQVFYKWQPGYQITNHDKIGLFREGWGSIIDAYATVCASCPTDEYQGSVVFDKDCLPPEEEYFYQLCYMSEDGAIGGVSEAFQFMVPNVAQDINQPSKEEPTSQINGTPLSTTEREAYDNNLKSLEHQIKVMELQNEELTHQSKQDKKELKGQVAHYRKKAKQADQLAQSYKASMEENKALSEAKISQLQKDYSELKMRCDRMIKDKNEELSHQQATIHKLETENFEQVEQMKKEVADERLKNTELETQLAQLRQELRAQTEKKHRILQKREREHSRLEHKLPVEQAHLRVRNGQQPENILVGHEVQGGARVTEKEKVQPSTEDNHTCPVCFKHFPPTVTHQHFERHVDRHFTD